MNRVRVTQIIFLHRRGWVEISFSITSYLFFSRSLRVTRHRTRLAKRKRFVFLPVAPDHSTLTVVCATLGSWPPWPPLLEWTLVGAPTRSRPVRRLLRWACVAAPRRRAPHTPAPRASPLSPRCGAALRVGPFGLEAERCHGAGVPARCPRTRCDVFGRWSTFLRR